MKKGIRRILVALIVLFLPVVILVPLSGAQGTKISTGAHLLPRVAGSAMVSQGNGVFVGISYHNDTSPPLRDMPPLPLVPKPEHAKENPKIPAHHQDFEDTAVQSEVVSPNMPAPILNFNGIPFPGVACNCAPPDTNGEVGLTQYVQIVNEGYQVFDKTTGASVLGPVGITSIWNGFGGVCQNQRGWRPCRPL